MHAEVLQLMGRWCRIRPLLEFFILALVHDEDQTNKMVAVLELSHWGSRFRYASRFTQSTLEKGEKKSLVPNKVGIICLCQLELDSYVMINETTMISSYQALLDAPAMVPPPGVVPNFVDPPNLRRLVIIMLTLFMAFSTLFILLRMYTKVFLLRKTAFEDCKPVSISPLICWYWCSPDVVILGWVRIHKQNQPYCCSRWCAVTGYRRVFFLRNDS